MSEDRAQEALSHLQAAMGELVEAARATLDVVEELVRDPSVLQSFVAVVQDTARAAAASARPHPGASPGAGSTPRSEPEPSTPRPPSPITRIDVS